MSSTKSASAIIRIRRGTTHPVSRIERLHLSISICRANLVGLCCCFCTDLGWSWSRIFECAITWRQSVRVLSRHAAYNATPSCHACYRSFFQSVCVLGYCVFPLVLASTLFLVLGNSVIRMVGTLVAYAWSTRGTDAALRVVTGNTHF